MAEGQTKGCIIERELDSRTFDYTTIAAVGGVLPEEYIVESPHFYQNGIPACVGMAIAGQKSVQEGKEVSPRFIWGLAKKAQGYLGWGTYITLALKQVVNTGACAFGAINEKVVKVKSDDYMRFDLTDDLLQSAAQHKASSYWYIPSGAWSLADQALIDNNIPLVVSMDWYDSYDKPKNGFLPPASGKSLGHAFVYKGWKIKDGKLARKFGNSWAETWGDNGDFWIFDKDIKDYNIGHFFILTDIPKEKAQAINTYSGKFIKTASSPKVYFCDKGLVKHIEDELVFWYKTTQGLGIVETVSDDIFSIFNEGLPVTLSDVLPKEMIYLLASLSDLGSVNPTYLQFLLSKAKKNI